MRSVVLLSAALIVVPTALAADVEEYRYAECDVPALAPAIGSLCGIEVAPGEEVRISVSDEMNGAIGFFLRFEGEASLECAAPAIDAEGSITIVVPEGCSALDVSIGPEGTLGSIRVERL